jgi:hypothetical protein
MFTSMLASRRSRLALLLSSLLAVACGAAHSAERPGRSAAVATSTQAFPPAPPDSLYAADEALRDVLSGPLEYVGTGPWPGQSRVSACAFRNQRVFVVNVYCTITDTQAFRIDVYSTQRGRVRIYAESKGQVSAHTRQDYFTFTVESEPPPALHVNIPQLSLAMSFQELSGYDQQRYRAFLPGCFGGQELSRKRGGCLGALEPRAAEWAAQNRAFLDRANADWYRVVSAMRAAATRYGKEPE